MKSKSIPGIFACLFLFAVNAGAENTVINIDPSEETGAVKVLNAVNNGPCTPKRTDQARDNFLVYKAARIPYARLHDSSLWRKHTVDILDIFPDFDADVNDPASYDFLLTDNYLKTIIQAGAKPFYRLGESIENIPKRYRVLPPKDNEKWAKICEHIIRHYNEGWADGFHYDIEYWEIWNEPDYNPNCWDGTAEQFYDLFSTTAKYLKKKFPKLMIGGPAFCSSKAVEPFLCEMQKRKVPIDFVSWHRYSEDPEKYTKRAAQIRSWMDRYGYKDAKSIIDEWNYVKNWTTDFPYSCETMVSEKGAAYYGAITVEFQNCSVDMSMYYDARPTTVFNGLFDLRTYAPMKPYWALYAWSNLLELGTTVRSVEDIPDVRVVSAKDDRGRLGIYLVRYNTDNNVTSPKTVSISINGMELKGKRINVQTVDRYYDFGNYPYTIDGNVLDVQMQPNSLSYITIE